MNSLGLIGAGYWGRNLARVFHQLGALSVVCDANEGVLAEQKANYPGIRTVRDPGEVFRDASLYSVAIAAPAARHYELARAALEAGKDVFVEKPLALGIAHAEALRDLAASRQRILMVGHLLHYHPCVIRLLDLVGAGELGSLRYITSHRLNLGKVRREENALWSFAPHDISVILALLGGQRPEAVRCTGGDYLNRGVADVTLTSLRFPKGIHAHVYVSWINPFKEQKMTVVGSKAMAVFDDTHPWEDKLILYRQPLEWRGGEVPVVTKTEARKVQVPSSEPLREECLHFLDCCATRKTPRTDAEEGLRVLHVLQAAQDSLDAGGEAR